MHLTATDRAHLRHSSEVMLRPLEHPNASDYLKAVARELLPVVGAKSAMCGTRDPDGNIDIVSDHWSDAQVGEFARFKLNDVGTQRALNMGGEVVTMRRVVGNDWDRYHEDPMVRQWYAPNDVRDAIAYMLYWPEDGAFATIELQADTFGTPRFGDEGTAILELLLPSFRAGMRIIHSLGKHRAALDGDFAELPVAVCECGRDGSVRRRSLSMSELLAADAQSITLMQRVRQVARTVAPSRASGTERFAIPHAHQITKTVQRSYRLSAAHSLGATKSSTSVLVTAGGLTPLSVTPDMISKRYYMTRREAEVAVLLGHGVRNDVIARSLSISPHTARRHTERVLAKLGVSSRAEAAAILRSIA